MYKKSLKLWYRDFFGVACEFLTPLLFGVFIILLYGMKEEKKTPDTLYYSKGEYQDLYPMGTSSYPNNYKERLIDLEARFKRDFMK